MAAISHSYAVTGFTLIAMSSSASEFVVKKEATLAPHEMTRYERRRQRMDTTVGRKAGPTPAELPNRAVALQPLLRKHTAASETTRQAHDEVITALTEAGLFRLRTPKRFGGHGASMRTVLDVTSALGEADGSTAWLVGLAATSAWMSSHASERAQQEVYGVDPDARSAGSLSPLPGRRVEGGALVSGRWPYATGSPHASWASLGVLLGDDVDQPGEPYLCLVPASELTLDDTWRTVGMRGTGSNTWVGEDVFVPAHRMISITGLVDGTLPATADDPHHRLTFLPLAMLDLFGPILGMGRGALALAIDQAPTKAMQYTFFDRQSDSTGVQLQVAEAALKLQTAELHAYQVADELDLAAAGGPALGYADRARIKAAIGYATQQVLDAINVLLNVHGAGSFAEANTMQQYWRDANTAARHAGLNATVGLEVFGKSLLGVPERITAMV
jgi:3-hydroxy-9,10-secoandrosta-1,3,5(10)-triene-9,17-dione monooxygenase